MKKLPSLLLICVILLCYSCNSNSKKVTELLKNFILKQYPAEINESTNFNFDSPIDLKYHDYLIINYLKHEYEIIEQQKDTAGYYFNPVFKLPSQEKFHLIVMAYGQLTADMSGQISLFVLSPEGEIIDKLNVYDSGLGYLLTTSFTKENEFTTTEESWEEDSENPEVSLTITKYKIDENGKIVKLSSEKGSKVSETLEVNSDEYFINNDGITGLKLGMKIAEIEKNLPNLKIELFFSDENMGNDYHLKNGENIICNFHEAQGVVYTIYPNDVYKTEKGISAGSTFGDLKKAYTFEKIEYDENDGSVFIYAKIKEMPNLNITFDVEIGEEIYEMDNNELMKKITDSTKIDGFFIQPQR